MNQGLDESTLAAAKPALRTASLSASTLFLASLRARPFGTGFGLVLEYGMFASAVVLALGLYLTRVPMRLVDRMFGLRLRERFIELIARVSPG